MANTKSYSGDDLLSAGEAVKTLPISRSTLLRAEEAGKITPFRTPGGHRRYRRSDLDSLFTQPNPAVSA